jgi:hypothetical protein
MQKRAFSGVDRKELMWCNAPSGRLVMFIWDLLKEEEQEERERREL